MDILFFISHALGMVATVVFLYSDIQEDDDKLDFYYTVGNVFFVAHLFLIGSIIPAATVFLAVVRNITCKAYSNKKLKTFFLLVFMVIFLINILGYGSVVDSIPSLVSVIMTVAFLFFGGHVLTICSIACSALWFFVGFSISSYPIMLLEVASIILLLYRALKQTRAVKDALP